MAKTPKQEQGSIQANMADLAQQPYTVPCYGKTEDMGNGIKRTTFYAKKDNQ